jgi:hypothetical protein
MHYLQEYGDTGPQPSTEVPPGSGGYGAGAATHAGSCADGKVERKASDAYEDDGPAMRELHPF